jgi:hypothetical protein
MRREWEASLAFSLFPSFLFPLFRRLGSSSRRVHFRTNPLPFGGVGEGLWAVDRAEPLTQLRLANKFASLRNPLPKGEG